MKTDGRHPVAVGGVGGSGTRVVATFLQQLGYFIGDDLNDALDNLWFTLLFKRRSILLADEAEFGALVALFVSRMAGSSVFSDEERARVLALASADRLQHQSPWLMERARSFLGGTTSRRRDQAWGWKEPNTHVVIDRLSACHPDLRYIHLVRHPLDMAVSRNQNQLQNWGPIFLGRDVTMNAATSLSYWCAAHRRIADFVRSRPDRAMIVDFDALCLDPDAHCRMMADLLAVTPSPDLVARFRGFVRPPASTGRCRSSDLSQYDRNDLAYVTEIGYAP